MAWIGERRFGAILLGSVLAILSAALPPGPCWAVDVGEPAPGFTLASTTGGDISLSEFRGKKWVLLEFYGSDFAPA